MRSAAAQHIRLEKVCGFHSVRYSQMPASGVPATAIALRASRSSRSSAARERSALKRSSRKIGVSASTISPKMSFCDVPRRAVADAHRPLAPEAGPVVEDALLEIRAPVDAVERRELQVRRAGGDVEQVLDEVLALLEVAEQAEGAERVVGVAQPAVAVVPGPPAPRRLGDRRGHRRDDRAGVLEAVELERERRADDLALVERRDVAVLHPALPVAHRLAQEAVAQRRRAAPRSGAPQVSTRCRRSVSANGCAAQVGERDVGRQPQRRSRSPRSGRGSSPAALRARPSTSRAAARSARGPAACRRAARRSGRAASAGRCGRAARSAARSRGRGTPAVRLEASSRGRWCSRGSAGRPARAVRRRRRTKRPPRSWSSSVAKTGSESKRGRQHQTTSPRALDERRELAVADEAEVFEPHRSDASRF